MLDYFLGAKAELDDLRNDMRKEYLDYIGNKELSLNARYLVFNALGSDLGYRESDVCGVPTEIYRSGDRERYQTYHMTEEIDNLTWQLPRNNVENLPDFDDLRQTNPNLYNLIDTIVSSNLWSYKHDW